MTRLILMSLVCFVPVMSTSANQLPLDDVPITKVYRKSLDPSRCKFEFSENLKWIFGIGTSNQLYLYDIASKRFNEYGPRPKDELGQPLVREPQGYKYVKMPEPHEALLWSVRNDRLMMWQNKNGRATVHAQQLSNDRLTRVRGVPLIYSAPGMHRMRQLVFLEPRQAQGYFLNIDHEGKRVVYNRFVKQRQLRFPTSISESLKCIAFQDEHEFLVVRSSGAKSSETTFQVDPAKHNRRRYVAQFFANDDKWFCILHKPTGAQLTQLDYYDSRSGEQLGTFAIPRTNLQDLQFNQNVLSDRAGNSLVLHWDDHNQHGVMLLRVKGERFVVSADSVQYPQLANVGEPLAMSRDGEMLLTSKLAILKMKDVERLKPPVGGVADAGGDGQQKWPPNGLMTLTKQSIDIERVDGTEPKEVVHIIQEGAGPLEFSPNDRWLAFGGGGNIYDFANQTTHDLSQILNVQFGDTSGVSAYAFSPDSRRMVTFTQNLAVLWDMTGATPAPLTSRKVDRTTGGVKRLIFLPRVPNAVDHYRVFAHGHNNIGVFDCDSHRITLVASRDTPQSFNHVSFSQDGKTIYGEAKNGTVKAYQLDNPMQARAILAPKNNNVSAAGYAWVSQPLAHSLHATQRRYYLTEWKTNNGGVPFELPFSVSRFGPLASRSHLEFVLSTPLRQPAEFVLLDPATRNVHKAQVKALTRADISAFDIANDRKHIAIKKSANDNRLLVLRCEFKAAKLNQLNVQNVNKAEGRAQIENTLAPLAEIRDAQRVLTELMQEYNLAIAESDALQKQRHLQRLQTAFEGLPRPDLTGKSQQQILIQQMKHTEQGIALMRKLLKEVKDET